MGVAGEAMTPLGDRRYMQEREFIFSSPTNHHGHNDTCTCKLGDKVRRKKLNTVYCYR